MLTSIIREQHNACEVRTYTDKIGQIADLQSFELECLWWHSQQEMSRAILTTHIWIVYKLRECTRPCECTCLAEIIFELLLNTQSGSECWPSRGDHAN